MKCIICNKDFEIISGTKAHNRKICYDCMPANLNKIERNMLYRQLIKTRVDTQKLDIGCQICGYNKCAEALEWHHDNDDKDFSPSNLLGSNGIKGYQMYLIEIQKCKLLCANCHREKHYKKQ